MVNPFTPKSDLIDFTLSNARRFYSSKGNPSGVKGLKTLSPLTLSLPRVTSYILLCLANARQFYSSKGNPREVKGLNHWDSIDTVIHGGGGSTVIPPPSGTAVTWLQTCTSQLLVDKALNWQNSIPKEIWHTIKCEIHVIMW